MKANELMIGDWMYAIDDNGEKHPCRANDLEYDYINKRDGFCVDFYGTGYNPEWPDVAFNVEPIPLTPEILEKNGFEGTPTSDLYIETDLWNKYAIELFPSEGSWLLRITDKTNKYSTSCNKVNVYLKYLHELQHALKLCGINKEIIL